MSQLCLCWTHKYDDDDDYIREHTHVFDRYYSANAYVSTVTPNNDRGKVGCMGNRLIEFKLNAQMLGKYVDEFVCAPFDK